ncbi:MAG: nidogen-like domain-containing protein [Nocardioidaceae bacterium]
MKERGRLDRSTSVCPNTKERGARNDTLQASHFGGDGTPCGHSGGSRSAAALGPDAIQAVSGCDANTLPRNDDGSTGAVASPFELNFHGTNYNSFYVNNNGNITFDGPLGTFTPFELATTSTPIIAPFFADVDTRNPGSSEVTYGSGTLNGVEVICVNWDDVGVGYFSNHVDKLNNFQLLLVNRSDTGAGNFDIVFNYDRIEWETGDASGGSGGLGGNSARAGFSNGDPSTPATSFELPGSAVDGALLDSSPTGLVNDSRNSTQLGRYIFPVRNGVAPSGGTITGTVTDPNGDPVLGAFVQVCPKTGAQCVWQGTTNALGGYSATGIPDGIYDIIAFPPAGTNYQPEQIDPEISGGNTVTGQDLRFSGPTGPPAGTSFNGTSGSANPPSTVVGQSNTVTVTGCDGGTGTLTVTGTYGGSLNVPMTEGPPGTYTATFSIPFTGPATITITIEGCPPIEFNIYIDPSGFVRTAAGAPIAGATVTLFRSDTGLPGSFEQVPDGSAIMSPANRDNPDTTDATGHFGWDTIAGFYKVRAEMAGCHAVGDPSQPFAETAVLPVPPPVTDLDLRLDGGPCASDTDPPVVSVPSDKTVNATSRAGAVVNYSGVTAEDEVDGPLDATCDPASGSVFPRGVTEVTCSATDAAGNTGTESFTVTVLSFRQQLEAARADVAGLESSLQGQQAKVRLASVLDFLDKALLPASWDADGSLVATEPGIAALRHIRSAVNYLRTPNAELSAASADLRVELIELVRTMAEAFYAERLADGYNAARLAQARSHLDVAASNQGTPLALEQAIKAWDNLDG